MARASSTSILVCGLRGPRAPLKPASWVLAGAPPALSAPMPSALWQQECSGTFGKYLFCSPSALPPFLRNLSAHIFDGGDRIDFRLQATAQPVVFFYNFELATEI